MTNQGPAQAVDLKALRVCPVDPDFFGDDIAARQRCDAVPPTEDNHRWDADGRIRAGSIEPQNLCENRGHGIVENDRRLLGIGARRWCGGGGG